MHYANGQLAKVGDLVFKLKSKTFSNDNECLGVVVHGTAAAMTCNLQVHIFAQRLNSDLGPGPWMPVVSPSPYCVTASDCIPIDPERLF